MTPTWISGSERYRFAHRDDIPRIAEMLSDPEVGRWLWFTPAPPEMIEQYFEPFVTQQTGELEAGETPRSSVFVVEGADRAVGTGGTFLGQGAALAVDGSPGGFEIGFQLPREAWGRGVGKRLARFLAAYAVHRCDAYRIEATCLEGNAASRAILAGLGLMLEGTRPGYRVRDDVRHTELLYGAEVSALDSAPIRRAADALGLS